MYKAAVNNYNPFCRSILSELSKSGTKLFLQNKNITGILGVSEEYGYRYALQLVEEFPDILQRVNEGDLQSAVETFLQVGGAPVYSYPGFRMEVSSYLTRYLYHACLICKYLQNLDETKEGLLEIGGGFGGLAFWIQKLLPLPYYIYDLNEANTLQQECFKTWGISLPLVDWSPHPDWNGQRESKGESTREWGHLFVISNYAYSEFSESFQEYYKTAVLNKVGGGFMIWNNLTGIPPFTTKSMTILPERPSFTENDNKFIYF